MLYPVNTDIKLYLISILLKMDSVAKLQLMIETMLQDPNTSQETRDYIGEILKTIKIIPIYEAKSILEHTLVKPINPLNITESEILQAQKSIQIENNLKENITH